MGIVHYSSLRLRPRITVLFETSQTTWNSNPTITDGLQSRTLDSTAFRSLDSASY